MKNTNSALISQNIKKYRILNKMTQEQLAALLDLDTQYYAQLERGERNFTIEKIIRVCSIFHISIENIIEIAPDTTIDTSSLQKEICKKLGNLSPTQLKMVDRFIEEIIPYAK